LDISTQIRQSEIISEPKDKDTLQIGHIAVIKVDDDPEIQYEIAGYGETDLKSIPAKIEYLAPIIRDLIGKKINTTITVKLAGKLKEVTLVKIL